MRSGRAAAILLIVTAWTTGCSALPMEPSLVVGTAAPPATAGRTIATPSLATYRRMVRDAVEEHGVAPARIAAALTRSGIRGRVETTAARSTIGAAMPVVDVAARADEDCLVAEISGTGTGASVRVVRVAPVAGRCLVGGPA